MFIMNTQIISLYHYILFYYKLLFFFFWSALSVAIDGNERMRGVHDKREYYCMRYHHAQDNIIIMLLLLLLLILLHRCQCEKEQRNEKTKRKKKLKVILAILYSIPMYYIVMIFYCLHLRGSWFYIKIILFIKRTHWAYYRSLLLKTIDRHKCIYTST